METDPVREELLRGLVDGDQRAYEQFWSEYGARLQRLVGRRIPAGLQQRLAPEDVVQSVCRTFFRRATKGQLQLADADSLWHLLCAITVNKVNMQIRFHMRDRRAASRERPIHGTKGDAELTPHTGEQAPDEAAMMAEQFERILGSLDEQEQKVVMLKLEDETNESIARQLGCSERTVRRLLNRIRAQLKTELLQSASQPAAK